MSTDASAPAAAVGADAVTCRGLDGTCRGDLVGAGGEGIDAGACAAIVPGGEVWSGSPTHRPSTNPATAKARPNGIILDTAPCWCRAGDHQDGFLKKVPNETRAGAFACRREMADVSGTVDERWLQAAIGRFEGALIQYASRMVGGDRAKDVVQETFLRLCAQERSEVEDRLGAWLFTVCRNRALDVLRKDSRLGPLPKTPIAASTQAPERTLEVRRALELMNTLPPQQQEVLRLKFSHGMSYREIATATGQSVSNVGYLIHIGLKRIRTQMERGHA